MPKAKEHPKGLSIGDGIAIIGLVILALAWAAGAIYVLSTGDQSVKVLSDNSKTVKDMDGGTAFALILMIFGPPVTALYLVYKVIVKQYD